MDIEKLIFDTQNKAKKLSEQSAQEKAMIDVLPVRFSKNLSALEKFIPSLYEQFNSYKPNRPFRFFCNENGAPNLLRLDECVSLYGQDPYGECLSQIDKVIEDGVIHCVDFVNQWYLDGQIHIKYNNEISKLKNKAALEGLKLSKALDMPIPLAMVYGVGLGYHLGYLYERCKIKNLFVFEPDPDVFFASLYCFDWYSLLDYLDSESLSIHIFIGLDERLIVSDMMEALHRKGAFWSAAYFSFFHYESKEILSLVSKVESEFYLLRSGWGFFDDNIYALAHSYINISDGTPLLLRDRCTEWVAEYPVFIVGNGPSLDQSISFVKAHAKEAVVIACGTAVSALLKADIVPDIYVAVERTKSSADFLKILDAEGFLKKMAFLSVDVIHPDCKSFFRRSAVAFKPNEPMFKLLARHIGADLSFDSIEYSNPFVGNTGLNYATLLGFKTMYLFGVDNGYKDQDKHHSTLSLYYNENKESKITAPMHDTFPVKANFGGEVRANQLFGLSIHNMSRLLSDFPDVHCYNCSDGAYIEGAQPLPLDSIAFVGDAINKTQIVDKIIDSCFKSFNPELIDFPSALNVGLFNDLIERFKSEWLGVSMNQDAIISLMQRHHDYLLYLFMSKETHIYRVLIGSINYFYANIISLMFSLADEDRSLFNAKVKVAIDFVLSFFDDAKNIYSDALSRQDTLYFSGLNVFKHEAK